MKNQGILRSKQAGNALILILVVIVLLAALTMTLTRTSSKTSGSLGGEEARIAAGKIMRQAQTVEAAIQKLKNLNSCGENQISFENTGGSSRAYVNTSSPTDKSCHVYDIGGAGLAYSRPDPGVLDTTKSALTDYGHWVFSAQQCVLEVGTGTGAAPCTVGNTELLLSLPHIREDICLAINDLLGITNTGGTPPLEDFDDDATGFDGTYAASVSDPEIGEGASGVNLVKHASGCLKDNAGVWNGSYIFYHTILAR